MHVRQAGKTECVTLVVRFLIHKLLMRAFSSPKGEQAKTDVDRIKRSVAQFRDRWQVEDREFNAVTARAYRFDDLVAESSNSPWRRRRPTRSCSQTGSSNR